MKVTVSEACRRAWESGQVERVAQVADALRLCHGCTYRAVHMTFCKAVGREIPLAEFDEYMYLADEGYTGTIDSLRHSGL